MSKGKLVTPAQLDFWFQNGMNVLFIGKHGVGKTAVVKSCFERNVPKWKYFSSATMDPWCDFVGIPRAVTRDGREVLEYVMSPDFTDDTVEALFFDEFNRSHKKVRDAVMELIQFKSINGRQFKNLKVVWAAINPVEEGDEKYQVEELDPAILDRFHVHVHVPYRPDRKFFEENYKKEGRSAVDWWLEQPESVQKEISPRRLEYAVKAVIAGNVSYVFPDKVDTAGFVKAVKSGSMTETISTFVKNKDKAGAETWLKSPTHIDILLTALKGNKSWWSFYLPLVPQEQLTRVMTTNRTLLKYLVDNETSEKEYSKVLDNFESSTGDRKILKWLRTHRVVTGSGIFKNMLTTMRVSGSTYDRAKIVSDLQKMGQNIPKSDYQTVQDILSTYVARTQFFTLAHGKMAGQKGTPYTVVKKIMTVVGMGPTLETAILNKGLKV